MLSRNDISLSFLKVLKDKRPGVLSRPGRQLRKLADEYRDRFVGKCFRLSTPEDNGLTLLRVTSADAVTHASNDGDYEWKSVVVKYDVLYVEPVWASLRSDSTDLNPKHAKYAAEVYGAAKCREISSELFSRKAEQLRALREI